MLKRLAVLALPILALAACLDEVPSNEVIAKLLEASANQELAVVRAAGTLPPPGQLVPDAVRIVNLRTIGGVTDSKGIHVASIQFDLMVELNGARMLSQRGAKARLKLAREGSGWRILEKQ
ncbi:hypothetical protein IGS68_18875 [Skermanella sp. TT6]|uniref:Lipoprotein n=1 Tax=Skermanella cutis TaxID=2775420 RepID=A0ABX7B1A3_9PROT|nr:hypothetical protein [Skermanella sp. TT6]QQP88108.1 hypothetical protein IGS68_18875 [Skermanella sp. TT6]